MWGEKKQTPGTKNMDSDDIELIYGKWLLLDMKVEKWNLGGKIQHYM